MTGAEVSATRSKALTDLSQIVLARYGEIFPNYAFTGCEAAVDLMAAEIKTLREGIRNELAACEECAGSGWISINGYGARICVKCSRLRVALGTANEHPKAAPSNAGGKTL